ncbi:MAG TPA: ankyrin repeat domain-containing protein, partial [Vicinamibacteria bacterium]|nr:ankyrin repeat domain-containing protein [Vicinamibacteria bacterium]
RFDAVKLLLEAGADRGHLQWTPLIEAVALGSVEDVERLIAAGAPLEEKDWWERTAFLVALLVGDLDKAQLLRERGADVKARGRCGAPPLFYAVQGHHPHVLRWLLSLGQEVDQRDEFERTALMEAVESADVDCVDLLIAAGADVDHEAPCGHVLSHAQTKAVALRLLDAGADPQHLSQEGQRALCGLGPVGGALEGVSLEDFQRGRTRRFGAANPERMQEPFWEAMVRTGNNAFVAARAFVPGREHDGPPVWCAQRFGQSITLLPDGRVVQIAGEHEDYYDPDFCIYNDVFVHDGQGGITLFGYPADVFPPTDFHTATLMDGVVYVIGALGYQGTRQYGHTPVYRLDLATLRMEPLATAGAAPGWIYGHRAERIGPHEIRIRGGTVVTARGGEEIHTENTAAFILDVSRLAWGREG